MEREGLIILMLIMLMYDDYSDYDDNYDDDALFDVAAALNEFGRHAHALGL